MSRQRGVGAQGGAKLQGLLALAIVVALFIGGIKIIPVYVRAYEFRDAMRSQAKFADVDRKPYNVVEEELYRKAQELDLPVTRDQIQVTPAPGGITVVSHFSVPVDLILFQRDFKFNFTAETRTAY